MSTLSLKEKRKRAPAWSAEEKEVLVSQVGKRVKLLDSQHSNEVMLKAKSEAYAEITKCVSAVFHSERNETQSKKNGKQRKVE